MGRGASGRPKRVKAKHRQIGKKPNAVVFLPRRAKERVAVLQADGKRDWLRK